MAKQTYRGRVDRERQRAEFDDISLREGETGTFSVRFAPLGETSATVVANHRCPNCGQPDDGYCRECDY